jgi:hypothetical protein
MHTHQSLFWPVPSSSLACTPSSGSLLRYNSFTTLILDLIGWTHIEMNSYNCTEIGSPTKTSQYKYSNKMISFFL